MQLKITESQARNLIELIDLWFYREIREDTNLDNIMWAWEILDIYKQCKDGVYKNVINNLQNQGANNESIRND